MGAGKIRWRPLIAVVAFGLAGCSPPWNAKIMNDLPVASRLRISGLGDCSVFGELSAGTSLNFECGRGLSNGARIRFTDANGRDCVAIASDIQRLVEEKTDPSFGGSHKYSYLQLSWLPCRPIAGSVKKPSV